MKNILVPVEEHTHIHSVLETALLLGRSFDSYVEGLAVSVNLPVAMPVDIAIGVPSALDPAVRREMAEASRQHFETVMKGRSVPHASLGASGLRFGWHDGELADDSFFGAYARVFDIAVVGRPSDKVNQPRLATVEAALFEGGRPVLVAPPTVPSTLGNTVVIAWNNSTETARAVAFAMPLLARAQRIIVLEVDGWGSPGPTGEELAKSLKRHGFNVETSIAPNPSGRPGEAVLSAAASLGCDLLIKGAYTQSRIRQMIFGGATSYILGHTSLPVLMAH
jgi:nucleotide-binding universal stress UspA family protein